MKNSRERWAIFAHPRTGRLFGRLKRGVEKDAETTLTDGEALSRMLSELVVLRSIKWLRKLLGREVPKNRPRAVSPGGPRRGR